MYNSNTLKKVCFFLYFIMLIYKLEAFLAIVNTVSSVLHFETHHLMLDLNGNIKVYN